MREETFKHGKICSQCKKEKSIDCFYKDKKTFDGLSCWCKECNKQYHREYYIKHQEERLEYQKEYQKNNLEKYKKYQREYRKTWYKNNLEKVREYQMNNSEKFKGYKKKWKKNNPEKAKKWEMDNPERARAIHREYKKTRRANDPQFKLNGNMASVIGFSLKGSKKGRSWEKLVGYTLQDLINRLSVNFQVGMNWNNYGEWHIDHRKPQSLFDYTTPEDPEFKECWCLANLQPLWAKDNLIKHNKF